MSGNRRFLAIGLAIAIITIAVFEPVRHHGFVAYDDDRYVTNNARVRSGLSWSGAAWAFRSFEEANWHPLTWLSHMADVSLWGMDAGAHHLGSLALHTASALLLFAVLRALTGAPWRSALLSTLFAVHPLHVESVAWVSERKDVLSTLFLWLALAGYTGYVRRPGPARYLATLGAFALGLATKPMLVTFPVLLLLLDWWPLGRTRVGLREKLPFFGLALCSGIVTLLAQSAGGSMVSLERFPWPARVANALASYLLYAWKSVVPTNLAFFYPRPEAGRTLWQAAAGALFLAGVSWFAWRRRKDLPFLATGWGWFIVGLLPVIGLVQVGEQSMADRYTYAPLAGLSLVLAWSLRWPSGPRGKSAAAVGVAVAITALGISARRQVSTWRDSETLFRHALSVIGPHPRVQNSLGAVLQGKGSLGEALEFHRAAVRGRPGNPSYRHNLGKALELSGSPAEAEAEYRRAIALDPAYGTAHLALGNLLLGSGRVAEAIGHYRESRRLGPEDPLSAYNLGRALAESGALREAVTEFRAAVSLRPGYAEAHNNLGAALGRLGSTEEALVHLLEALRLNPANPRTHFNIGDLLQRKGKTEEAAAAFREALRLDPSFRAARARLALLGG